MIKAIVFDCFGVLMIDTITAYQDLHPEVSSDLIDVNRQADVGFISQMEQIELYKTLTGDDENTIVNYLGKEHRLNEPVVRLIKQLKVNFNVGMLSNIGSSWYQQLVPEEVRDLFDVTVLSHEIGMVKPYPEIFEYLLIQLDMDPHQVLFIDDILDNCEGARAVGIAAIQYEGIDDLKQKIQTYID